MKYRMSKWLLSSIVGLFCAASSFAADSNLGESGEIKFCKGLLSPYTGCPAAELRKQADLLVSPVAIYEYVRNNYDYALYFGALSGSINAYQAGRGNDVDLAATLIAMLRSQNIPARYAVGTVELAVSDVQLWLQVDQGATSLPTSLMKNQGIQRVQYTGDKNSGMQFEHVWVEALVPYTKYRGAGAQTTLCTAVSPPSECHWVSLDPSFKKYDMGSGVNGPAPLDPYKALNFETSFPYVAGSDSSFLNKYYNAIKNGDGYFKDKNPLEIYQEQVLKWMRTNAPGKSINDIFASKGIVTEYAGLLPASLPYKISGSVSSYDSIADHDAAVPSKELKPWGLRVNVQIQVACGSSFCESNPKYFYLTDLIYQRAAIVVQAVTNNLVLRAGGVDTVILTPTEMTALSGKPSVSSFTIVLTTDGAPATDVTASYVDVIECDGTTRKVGAAGPGFTDEITKACYRATWGSYNILALGGESSNWGQVHRAADDLLGAIKKYPIVFDPSYLTPAGKKCTEVKNTFGCPPFVDSNGNGVRDASEKRLSDSPQAMDELTGGVLYAAAMQYFSQLRDHIASLDKINKIKTPIVGFMGLVSSGSSPSYIGDTAYSIKPDGMLIDMKGMNVHGCWRIDGSGTSNSHCDMIGHIASSLEHETWQALTGYDAISTVRGIQIALNDNATSLMNLNKSATVDDIQSMYGGFGYSSAPPSNFIYHEYRIAFPVSWGLPARQYNFAAWSDPLPGHSDFVNPTDQNHDGTHCFSMIKKAPVSKSDSHLGWMWYQNDDWWLGVGYSLGGDIKRWQGLESSNGLSYVFTKNQVDRFGQTIPAGKNLKFAIDQTYRYMKNSFFPMADQGSGLPYSFVDYFDRNVGPQNFNQADFVYRECSDPAAKAQPVMRIQQIRDFLMWQDLSMTSAQVVIPSKRTKGSGFDFSVSVQKVFDKNTGRLLMDTLDISNTAGVFAGGGYVPLPDFEMGVGHGDE